MAIDPRVGLLGLGALLVVLALLGGRLLGDSVPSRLRFALQAGIGVLAIALIAWVLLGYLGVRGSSAPADAAARATRPLPVDLVQVAGSELSACALPSPPALPDGASASREQMGSARQAFEAYDAATNAYTKCIDATVTRVAAQQGRGAPREELERLQAFGTTAHNTAINQEQGVADQLNTQIRAYKAKQPQ
jgi:hypothetical protein